MKSMMSICFAASLAFLTAAPAQAEVAKGTGTGVTKANACASAKAAAARQCNALIAGGRVDRYDACDCEEINLMYDKWSCSVDAYCGGNSTSHVISLPALPSEPARAPGEVGVL